MGILGVAAAGWLAAPAAESAQAPACADGAPTVRSHGKTFTGACESPWNRPHTGVAEFLGIQYATAPRWRAPALVEPQGGAATAFGPACPQSGTANTAEQCLYLNIYTPVGAPGGAAGKLPVILFIHGGSFISGSGGDPMYDGSALAAQGPAVVVTINYRLGALGFLTDAPLGLAGNYGLEDQQAALAWVNRYIGAFGGDPAAVTVTGESAGAMSVGLQLFSIADNRIVDPPVDNRTLFRAAVMESNPLSTRYPSTAEASRAGQGFITFLCAALGTAAPPDCTGSAAALRTIPSSVMVTQQQAYLASPPQDSAGSRRGGRHRSSEAAAPVSFGPTRDGHGEGGQTLVQNQPSSGYYAPAAARNARPYVFGTNRNEGSVFAAMVNDSYAGTPGGFTRKDYTAVLNADYNGNAAAIQRVPAYNPDHQRPVAYWSRSAAALGNAITDHGFNCANLDAADTVLKQLTSLKAAGRIATIPPSYGYHFTQRPFFDLYREIPPPIGACNPDNPGSPSTCHAEELPYVFGTLATLAQPLVLHPPTPSDHALQSGMVAAWAAFAVDPGAPAAGFPTAYTGDGTVIQFNGTASRPIPLRQEAHCRMWNRYAP